MTKLSLHLSVAVALAGVLVSNARLSAHPLGALTNQQLAQARAATAKYHDLATALADGYTPMGFNPEEGIYEFVNFNLVDCTLDPTHPEGLSFVQSGNTLRLVGVEYAVPFGCTEAGVPPDGFATDAEEWGQEGDLPVWRLNVMIWAGSHDGAFGSTEEGGSAR